jgi:hypothetical protein
MDLAGVKLLINFHKPSVIERFGLGHSRHSETCVFESRTQLSNWGQLFENERTEAVTSLRDL